MEDPTAPGAVTPGSGNGAVNAITPELRNELQKIVVGVLKTHLPKQLKEALSPEAMQPLLQPIMEQSLLAMAQEGTPEAQAEPTGGNSAAPAAPANAQDDPRFAEIQRQIKAERERNDRLELAIKAEKAATEKALGDAKNGRILSHARAELARALGSEAAGAMAARDLHGRQWFDEGEGGKIVWRTTGEDGAAGTVSFDEGLKAWLGSPEGKQLVPARASQVGAPPVGMPWPQASSVPPGQSPFHPGTVIKNPVLAQMGKDVMGVEPTMGAGMVNAAVGPGQPSAPPFQIGPVRNGT